MRKLSRRESILIILLIILSAVYLVSQYWYLPLLSEIKHLEIKREDLAQQWNRMQQSLSQKETLQQRNTLLDREIRELQEQMIPAHASFVLWEEIRELAEQSEVELTLLQEGSSANQQFAVQFQVRGENGAVLTFINNMRNFPHVSVVTEGKMDFMSEDEVIASFSVISAVK